MLFSDRLASAVAQRGSAVVLGLDPHLELFPPPLRERASSSDRETVASAVESFCRDTIDAAADIVPIVKPQFDPSACLKVSLYLLSSGEISDPLTLLPLYPRPPEAVTLWEKRRKHHPKGQ